MINETTDDLATSFIRVEVRLREKPILSFAKLHGHGAFFVVIGHVVDPRAHGIASHQPI
jgi:hypothetical protein